VIHHGPNVGNSCREIVTIHHLPVSGQTKTKKTQDSLEGLQQVGLENRIALEGGDVSLSEKRSVWVELTWLWQGEKPLDKVVKGKEIGHFHILATTGYEFPAGPGSDTTNFFNANLHLDRQMFGWLYPLVEFNRNYHTRSVSFDRPARRGFFDLNNLESSGNILTLAVGADAVLVRERLEIGAAYTTPIATMGRFLQAQNTRGQS
jgi:hypothetical protein